MQLNKCRNRESRDRSSDHTRPHQVTASTMIPHRELDIINSISNARNALETLFSHHLQGHMLNLGAIGPLRREIRRLPSLTRPPDTL